MQTVGMVLFLSTCCVCSTAGLWDPVAPRNEVLKSMRDAEDPGVTLTTLFDDPARAGIMLTVMFMTLGGLTTAVIGLGLQAGNLRAARAAVVAHALLLCVLIAAGIALWAGHAPLGFRLWHAALTLLLIALVGFSIAAFKDIRRNPPPPDEPLPTDLLTNLPRPSLPAHPTPQDIARRREWLRAESQNLDQIEKTLQDRDSKPHDQPDNT